MLRGVRKGKKKGETRHRLKGSKETRVGGKGRNPRALTLLIPGASKTGRIFEIPKHRKEPLGKYKSR